MPRNASRSALIAALLLALPLASAPAGDRPFEVGVHGANIRLDDSFQRKELEAGLGRDQFLGKDGTRLIFLEQIASLPGSAVPRAMLQRSLEGIRNSPILQFVETDPIESRVRGERHELTAGARCKSSGMPVHYEVAAISEGGLAHLVLAISAGKPTADLAASALRDALDDFAYPLPHSEWGRESALRPETFGFEWGKVSITYRPLLWEPESVSRTAFLQVSASGDMTYFYAFERADEERATYAGSVIALFEEGDPPYDMGEPVPRTVAGLPGTEIEGMTRAGDSSLRILLLDTGPRTLVELRLECPHPEEDVDAIWEAWLAGVSIEVYPEVTAFPAPPASSPAAPREAPPEIAGWLAGSHWLGTVPGARARGAIPAGDGFLVFGSAGLHRVGGDGSVTQLRGNGQDVPPNSVAAPGDEILLRVDGALHSVDESGELAPIEPRIRARAPLAESRLEVRAEGPASRFGWTLLPNHPSERLVEVGAGGERELASLAAEEIVWLVPSGDRSAVLIARRPRSLDGTSYRSDRLACVARSATGEETALGEWDASHIAPAADGWVVTGRPIGGDHGVHHLPRNGSPELWISGHDFIGVTSEGSYAVVAGGAHLPARGAAGGTALYRVELETLRRLGPATMPFGGRRLEEIATEALLRTEGGRDAIFATRESIEAFAALCRGISEERCGRPLPRGAVELDHVFFHWIRGASEIGEGGFTALCALLCEALFAGGGEWVPGRLVAVAQPRRGGANRATASAWARSVPRIVAETLYDEEGYWQPVSGVLADLEGRTLLIGVDDDALLAALHERSDAPMYALLAAADPGPLLAHAREHPQNIYLRTEIYQHLAARGRHADIRALASTFLAAPEPLFIDVKADLAARLETAAAAERTELTVDLGEAIRRFPRSPFLYEILGEACRRRADPSDDRRARLCFQQVLELVEEGELAERARRALEELSPGARPEEE